MGSSNLSRRSFLKSSAATATGAVIAATPLAAAAVGAEAATPSAAVTDPTGAAPLEPVMAYVHNAPAGEVTILKGTSQTTYNDPALVKRLLAAAPGDDA